MCLFLWNLSMELQGQGYWRLSNSMESICYRRLLNLPYETHRRYLPSLVGTSSAKHQIYTRFVEMVSKMENSDNARISFLTRQCRNLPRLIIGGNLKMIGNALGVEMPAVKTGAGGLLWHARVSELSDNDKAAIMQIKELSMWEGPMIQ